MEGETTRIALNLMRSGGFTYWRKWVRRFIFYRLFSIFLSNTRSSQQPRQHLSQTYTPGLFDVLLSSDWRLEIGFLIMFELFEGLYCSFVLGVGLAALDVRCSRKPLYQSLQHLHSTCFAKRQDNVLFRPCYFQRSSERDFTQLLPRYQYP